MKKNVRLLNKQNKHWYSHEKNTKWAIQDKEGNWWLVNGSEFPEKKIEEDEEVKCGLPPSFDFEKFAETVAVATRLSDDLVELELEKLEHIRSIADQDDEKELTFN